MKNLFHHWRKIEKLLDSNKHVLLAFDYDGTLTPIVKKPELAKLSPSMKNLLRDISLNPFFSLAVISGRPLKEIEKMVGLKKVIYAGNHGLEIKGPEVNFVDPTAQKAQPLMKNLYKLLSGKLRSVKGALVENKGLSLSVHFRLVKDKKDLQKLDKLFYNIISPLERRRKIKVTFGKKVYEIRPPVAWDKGKCLSRLLIEESRKGESPFPVVFGDDRTDEDMFRVIRKKGVSVFIGPPGRSSSARYYINNVSELKEILKRIERKYA